MTLARALCRNTVHRHEPPITRSPVLVLHKDEPRQFIVISKPGSVVSACCLLVRTLTVVADLYLFDHDSQYMLQEGTTSTPCWSSSNQITGLPLTVRPQLTFFSDQPQTTHLR